MRVKIIKATLPSFWYAGQIGCEFNVEEHTHDKYKLFKDITLSSTISKSDCEVLPENQTFQDGINEGFETGMDYIKSNPDKVVITKEEYADLIANQRIPETPSKPEPFDLERALNGEKFTWNEKPGLYCIIGKSPNGYQSDHGCKYVVEQVDWKGDIYLWRWTAEELSKFTMAPKEPQAITGWIGLYKDHACTDLHNSKESCKASVNDEYVGGPLIALGQVTFTL